MDGFRPPHGSTWSRWTFGWVLGLYLVSAPAAQAFFPPVIQPPGPPVTPPPINPPPVVVPPVDPPPVVVPPRQVPEPATIITALVGLATAAGYRRLRQRRHNPSTSDSSHQLP
jgi:hypothetical protein